MKIFGFLVSILFGFFSFVSAFEILPENANCYNNKLVCCYIVAPFLVETLISIFSFLFFLKIRSTHNILIVSFFVAVSPIIGAYFVIAFFLVWGYFLIFLLLILVLISDIYLLKKCESIQKSSQPHS